MMFRRPESNEVSEYPTMYAVGEVCDHLPGIEMESPTSTAGSPIQSISIVSSFIRAAILANTADALACVVISGLLEI